MKKKYLATVATLATVVMMAACGNNNTAETPTPTPTVEATATPAPTETPAPVVDHAQMIQNIHQALKEEYGTLYLPDMQMQEAEWYMQDLLGLDVSWYDEAIVEVPGMSFGVDKFIIIHPTEGNLENVEKALKDFKNSQITDAHQYPENMPKLQAAEVATIGDYVCYMIFTGRLAETQFENQEDAIKAYEEANQEAKEVVAGVVSGEIVVVPWTEMEKMRNEIVKWYGTTYYPNMKVHKDEASLSQWVNDTLKLDASWFDEIIIEVPMISANVDTLVLVSTTEGNAENVVKALEAYKKYLVEDSFQYPMNVARVQSAVVSQVGDYVCFSLLGGAVDDPELYGITTDAELAEYYEAMNMNAIYAMESYLSVEIPY